MTSLLACIDKTQSLMSSENQSQKPKTWESLLFQSFSAPYTSINAKLFICKVLINRVKEIDWDYRIWISHVSKFVVENNAFSRPSLSGLNTFLQDCCVMILRWMKNLSEDDLASYKNDFKRLLASDIPIISHDS